MTTPLELLESVQRRVLWLATSIVHHANKVRETSSGVKVGGHQASSASMVAIMTARRRGRGAAGSADPAAAADRRDRDAMGGGDPAGSAACAV